VQAKVVNEDFLLGKGIMGPTFDDGSGCGGGGDMDAGLFHLLTGHTSPVTCVAVSCNADIVVSGSSSGSCIVHALR
jgi:hypothetical protein